ncbi:hypothetical protein IJF93_01800 [Candidatus Saccharibacteria bacterium]|nr:hypothetical protein [Candidatus Saccharibacteria bacterium]
MKDKKKIVSIIVFVVGMITLVVGVVFLVLGFVSKPAIQDGEYLVEVGSWEEEGAPGVVWTFTEIGKGSLTTNNQTNNYDFIWAIEGDKLKIETDWLYTLENEYVYKIDQDKGTLTLSNPDEGVEEIVFRAVSTDETSLE